MIAEPIRYMVVCDHPEINRRYYVADIDDDRPSGGRVHFQLYRGEMATTATALNKRGSRRVIPFACGVCLLKVEIQETCSIGSPCTESSYSPWQSSRSKPCRTRCAIPTLGLT